MILSSSAGQRARTRDAAARRPRATIAHCARARRDARRRESLPAVRRHGENFPSSPPPERETRRKDRALNRGVKVGRRQVKSSVCTHPETGASAWATNHTPHATRIGVGAVQQIYCSESSSQSRQNRQPAPLARLPRSSSASTTRAPQKLWCKKVAMWRWRHRLQLPLQRKTAPLMLRRSQHQLMPPTERSQPTCSVANARRGE